MKPDDPRVVAVATAIVSLVEHLSIAPGAGASPPHGDALVPINGEALAALGLELRPVARLADSGELRTLRIGRRRYTRQSWLVALADKLASAAPAPTPQCVPEAPAAIAPASTLLADIQRSLSRRRRTRQSKSSNIGP